MSRQPQTTSVPTQVPAPRPAENPTTSVVPVPSQASPDHDDQSAEHQLHWVEWLGQERVDARAYTEQQRRPRNHGGVCALLFGIVALSLTSYPVLGYGSVVLGAIGLLHAVAGFSNVRNGRATNPITTSIGAGISLAAMVLPWIFMTTSLGAVETSSGRTGSDQTSTSAGTDSGTGTGTDSDLSEFASCIERASTPEELNACN